MKSTRMSKKILMKKYQHMLSKVLKVSQRVVQTWVTLTVRGRSILEVGAKIAETCPPPPPIVLSLGHGTFKGNCSDDLNALVAQITVLLRIMLWKAVNVIRRILNWILKGIGSRCNWARMGLICSLCLVSVKSLAAVLWTNWSCEIVDSLKQENKELQ